MADEMVRNPAQDILAELLNSIKGGVLDCVCMILNNQDSEINQRQEGIGNYLGIFSNCVISSEHGLCIRNEDGEEQEISGDRSINQFFNELNSLVREMRNTNTGTQFKDVCHRIIKLCMDANGAGLPIGENGRFYPLIWTNGALGKHEALLQQEEFTNYVTNNLSPPFAIVTTCFQRIIERIILTQEELNDNSRTLVPFCKEIKKQMMLAERNMKQIIELEKQNNQRRADMQSEDPKEKRRRQEKAKEEYRISSAKLIPMWRVVSEVYAEHFDIKSIAKHLRIESGQHIQTAIPKSKMVQAEQIKISSDACLFTNELTTILARVAKYNLDSRRFNKAHIFRKTKVLKLSKCIRFPRKMKVQIGKKSVALSNGDLVLKGPRDGKATYFKVPIQTLLKYVEEATEENGGNMLTIRETLTAIRNAGSLRGPVDITENRDYLRNIGGIITESMINSASNERIVLTSNMESHDPIEPENLLEMRRRRERVR